MKTNSRLLLSVVGLVCCMLAAATGINGMCLGRRQRTLTREKATTGGTTSGAAPWPPGRIRHWCDGAQGWGKPAPEIQSGQAGQSYGAQASVRAVSPHGRDRPDVTVGLGRRRPPGTSTDTGQRDRPTVVQRRGHRGADGMGTPDGPRQRDGHCARDRVRNSLVTLHGSRDGNRSRDILGPWDRDRGPVRFSGSGFGDWPLGRYEPVCRTGTRGGPSVAIGDAGRGWYLQWNRTTRTGVGTFSGSDADRGRYVQWIGTFTAEGDCHWPRKETRVFGTDTATDSAS